jgi:hypothetical protein
VDATARQLQSDRQNISTLEEAIALLKIRIGELAADRTTQERLIAVQQAHTEELRRQRAVRERETDPIIQAFRESRHRNAADGIDEENLDIIIWWIANKSAWSRWQVAQRGGHLREDLLLNTTASYFEQLLAEGKIIVRACRRNETTYEEIRPDFWRRTYLRVDEDLVRVWKVSITRRTVVDKTDLPDYVDPCCDWREVKRIFPEEDKELDAITHSLVKHRSET